MFIIVKRSGHTLKLFQIDLGILGYADDTVTICLTVQKVRETIKLIEDFCKREDIELNGKKTVWLKLGEKPLSHPISKIRVPKNPEQDENLKVNGIQIAKVCEFKYLGYIITSDNNENIHIDKRKT